MRLTIRHETSYDYRPAAPQAALRLRLFPPACAPQKPVEWRVSVNDDQVERMLTDAWGDGEALWFSPAAVETVRIVAEGVIETQDRAGVVGELGRGRPAVFRRPTPLTQASREIAALAEEVADDDRLSALHRLNAAIADAVAYRPGATAMETTADQALKLGVGVCQDLTHLFISAARTLGAPARYVVGYLHDPDAPLVETHAWAEAHVEELGWVGFDPTHRTSPTERYVRLCCGFDAADAAPLRGTIRGAAVEEAFSVAVNMGQAQQ
jgi:transglutaminase-like putative cysteine protease